MAFVLAACLAAGAYAANETYRFDIPPGAADEVVSAIAEQADKQVLFPIDRIRLIEANGLSGDYTVQGALEMALEGTGLRAAITERGVITVMFAHDHGVNGEDVGVTDNRRSSLLAGVAAFLFVGNGAFAQDEQEAERIVVTGSRITTTDGMVSPTPVTVTTTAELSELEPGTTLAEQLDNVPQFLNTQTAQRGGATLFGDAAGSYLNMRNLGKQRTLVLFDGSRVVPADRAGAVNVDNFPTALIRSVDVVTGGASAAYGADAVAGVVNFVLDREFEGLELDVSGGVTEFGDGENWGGSIAGGRRIGDRLHVIGSVEARHVEQIYRRPQDLDNYAGWGWVINPDWTPGNTSVPQRLTLPHVHSATQAPAGMIVGPAGFALNGFVFTDDGEGVRPFVTGDVPARTGAGSNGLQAGGPEAAIAEAANQNGAEGAGVEQRSAFAGFQYDLAPSTELFGQFMIGRTESRAEDRQGTLEMGQQYFWTAYVDNAFMPEPLRQAMIDEGLTSIQIHKIGEIVGGEGNINDKRSEINISRMWSGTLGFEHAFANDWTLRGSWQRGDSELTSEGRGYLRIDRWYMAMDAVVDPDTGSIVCNVQTFDPTPEELAASVAGVLVPTTRITEFPDGVMPIDSPIVNDNAIRDCTPLNMFGLGNASEGAQRYVIGDKKGYRDLEQDFAELLLTGELYQGWGAGPLTFAAGLTWREEWFNQFTAPIEMERSIVNAPSVGIRGISNGLSGGNRSAHNFSATSWATGEFNVWEWFAELNVPVWQSSGGSQRLDTSFAFRRSDYSTTGEIDSWKIGAEAQIYSDLRVRATSSRDVREPTFGEQFESTGGGSNISDPVTGTSYTITQLAGGNPNLKPEEADTLTAGFVYTPSFAGWADGFQLSADWYEIDIDGFVGSLGGQAIINGCASGDAMLCELVFRGSAGTIERVLNINLNINQAITSGVDIEARYNYEPDFFSSLEENLSFRVLAGYLTKAEQILPTTVNDMLGRLNNPEWTATATAGYDVGPYGVRVTARYYDETLFDDGARTWVQGVDVDDNTRDSQTTYNLGFQYRGETDSGSNWTAGFQITNVFDEDPPINPTQNQRAGGGAQQSVLDQYDSYGRRYQVSLNYRF